MKPFLLLARKRQGQERDLAAAHKHSNRPQGVSFFKSVDVTSGITENGKVIINSSKDPEKLRSMLNDFNGEICTIDAEKISMETLGKNFPNTPMLAAVVKVSGVIDENRFINDMEESFRHKFYHKPEMVEGNMKALKKSMKEVRVG